MDANYNPSITKISVPLIRGLMRELEAMVNRAALTGCTGRDHESNKKPESDVRGGARPEGVLPNEQSELVIQHKRYCTPEIYIRGCALY
jgi:hypothetical protein